MMRETFVGQIIADGRVTIPETIRAILCVKEGDYVKIVIEKKETAKEV